MSLFGSKVPHLIERNVAKVLMVDRWVFEIFTSLKRLSFDVLSGISEVLMRSVVASARVSESFGRKYMLFATMFFLKDLASAQASSSDGSTSRNGSTISLCTLLLLNSRSYNRTASLRVILLFG
jgi:hypothetical protein